MKKQSRSRVYAGFQKKKKKTISDEFYAPFPPLSETIEEVINLLDSLEVKSMNEGNAKMTGEIDAEWFFSFFSREQGKRTSQNQVTKAPLRNYAHK